MLQELNNLPFFPSEILPLFLYLGDRRHVYNTTMNYDLKIHTHVRLGNDRELPPAFPESTEELHVDVEDTPESDLGPHFAKIVDFIGKNDTSIWERFLRVKFWCNFQYTH